MRSRKRPREGTKACEEFDIRKLTRRCLKLWKLVVKARAGNKCEVCGSRKKVQAHHIEDTRLCPVLRYEPRNGVACEPKCHKFGKDSFHKSFIFAYEFLMVHRAEDVVYLQEHRNDKVEITKEYLTKQIEMLEKLLKGLSFTV